MSSYAIAQQPAVAGAMAAALAPAAAAAAFAPAAARFDGARS
ncbi:hypothetical protein [Streptacidiphilus sp. EB129]